MSTITRNPDRTKGSRTDDRLSTQGLLAPNSEPEEVITKCAAAVEMTRPWKSQTDFHRRLEISHRTRDFHIPTSRSLFHFREKNVE
jgi:hypothetical protein